MKRTLWTRDFTRITAATALGAAGGIISQFALSFLVFDETGSTLAAALSVAIQLIPMVLLPLIIAPMMDPAAQTVSGMGRSAQRRMLRRSGDLPAAQRLLLHRLSGLFSAGVVSRRF